MRVSRTNLAVRQLIGQKRVGEDFQRSEEPPDPSPLPGGGHFDVGYRGDPNAQRRRHRPTPTAWNQQNRPQAQPQFVGSSTRQREHY